MSTVYLAIQKSVEREVALKVMSPSLAGDPTFGSRFYREAKIVGQLSHPNIVSIYDVGSYKQYNYITMDYLPGSPLQDRLDDGVSTDDALRVIREIASALSYAHQSGYIHRDIKPDNILFRDDGTAVLCDFGIAKALKGNIKMTNFGSVLGTPHYMSPEQAQGKEIDGRADLYSLGVVFFEMLTGQVPYSGDDAVAVAVKHMTSAIPKLPRQLKKIQPIIDKMMDKKAANRYQTGQDVIKAIDELSISLAKNSATLPPDTGSTTVQMVNLVSALFTTLWSAIDLSFKRLMLTKITFRSDTAELSNKQLEDLDNFILNDEEGDLPEELSDVALIQDTVEQPAIGYRWSRLYIPALVIFTAVLGFMYFQGKPSTPVSSQTPALAVEKPAVIEAIPIPDPVAAEITHDITPENMSLEEETVPDERIEQIEAEAPTIEEYALHINTAPRNANVRILNIGPRYKDGIKLQNGNYHIEITAKDYVPKKFWIQISERNKHLDITLNPTRRLLEPGSITTDSISDGIEGPKMVVLPQTTIPIDENNNLSLSTAVAISQHEITFAQYDEFAKSTGRSLPNDFGWGRGNRPVIGISYQDAIAYANWLSETTGEYYRLPTKTEWEFASRGGKNTEYWWGQDGKEKMANCKRGCKSKFSKLFGTTTAPSGSFQANPYGVYDTAGNVAEWLNNCEEWLDANQTQCKSAFIAGGSHKDTVKNIQANSVELISTDTANKYVGIRLLLEL